MRMKTCLKIVLAALIMSCSVLAMAGARNGYRIVFFDKSQKPDPEMRKQLVNYFNSKLPSDTYVCDQINQLIDFDLVFISKLPKGVTQPLILDSLGSDTRALKSLRKALRSYRDAEITQGFDGLLVFDANAQVIELTTIGATEGGTKRKATVDAKRSLNPATIKALFCGSLGSLEYTYMD